MTTPDLSLDAAGAFLRSAALRFDVVGGDRVTGVIAAGPEQHTPWGVVHGGVFTAAVSGRGQYAVGLANHTDFLRPHLEGDLHVEATPVQQGRTQQLWQCDIVRPDGKLVARGQLRLQNVELPAGGA